MSTEPKPTPKEMAIRAWSLGAYDQVARDYLPVAAQLVELADMTAADHVLDVACGSGNVALTAWRTGASVTGVDLVPGMLDLARENAANMGAGDVDWQEGEAEALPFDDDAFDVALMCFGPEVTRDAEAAIRELVRVTGSDGRVAFGSWAPTVEPIFTAPAAYLPDPPKLADFSWGDKDRVRTRLDGMVRDIEFTSGELSLPSLSPQHFWTHLVKHAGPFMAMVGQVPESDRAALTEDAIAAIEPYFASNAVGLDYLITTATA